MLDHACECCGGLSFGFFFRDHRAGVVNQGTPIAQPNGRMQEPEALTFGGIKGQTFSPVEMVFIPLQPGTSAIRLDPERALIGTLKKAFPIDRSGRIQPQEFEGEPSSSSGGAPSTLMDAWIETSLLDPPGLSQSRSSSFATEAASRAN